MTRGTILREVQGLMLWTGRSLIILLVAIKAVRGSSGIALAMTLLTVQANMRAGKREVCQVVIKIVQSCTRWMAGIAGIVGIHITGNSLMVVIGLSLDVAICTGKLRKVSRCSMAVLAFRPCPFMRTAINREIDGIVVGEAAIASLPSFIGRMALQTIKAKIQRLVIGRSAAFVICPVAGDAVIAHSFKAQVRFGLMTIHTKQHFMHTG